MPLTLDDVAAHLELKDNAPPAEDTPERAELQRFFDAALDHVQLKCGAVVGTKSVRVSSAGGRQLVLPVVRLASVGAITDPNATAVIPESTDPLTGVITVPVGVPGVWTVAVTGDEDLPAGLELAVLEITKHLYGSQRVTVARPGARPTGGSSANPAYSIPNRAKDLMAPYLLP